MGKKKVTPVDSDYSGRPLGRPTPEELEDVDWYEDLADLEGLESDDGVELVIGLDARCYYPGRNGWPDLERGAVDPVTLEPLDDEHADRPAQ